MRLRIKLKEFFRPTIAKIVLSVIMGYVVVLIVLGLSGTICTQCTEFTSRNTTCGCYRTIDLGFEPTLKEAAIFAFVISYLIISAVLYYLRNYTD